MHEFFYKSAVKIKFSQIFCRQRTRMRHMRSNLYSRLDIARYLHGDSILAQSVKSHLWKSQRISISLIHDFGLGWFRVSTNFMFIICLDISCLHRIFGIRHVAIYSVGEKQKRIEPFRT